MKKQRRIALRQLFEDEASGYLWIALKVVNHGACSRQSAFEGILSKCGICEDSSEGKCAKLVPVTILPFTLMVVQWNRCRSETSRFKLHLATQKYPKCSVTPRQRKRPGKIQQDRFATVCMCRLMAAGYASAKLSRMNDCNDCQERRVPMLKPLQLLRTDTS